MPITLIDLKKLVKLLAKFLKLVVMSVRGVFDISLLFLLKID